MLKSENKWNSLKTDWVLLKSSILKNRKKTYSCIKRKEDDKCERIAWTMKKKEWDSLTHTLPESQEERIDSMNDKLYLKR